MGPFLCNKLRRQRFNTGLLQGKQKCIHVVCVNATKLCPMTRNDASHADDWGVIVVHIQECRLCYRFTVPQTATNWQLGMFTAYTVIGVRRIHICININSVIRCSCWHCTKMLILLGNDVIICAFQIQEFLHTAILSTTIGRLRNNRTITNDAVMCLNKLETLGNKFKSRCTVAHKNDAVFIWRSVEMLQSSAQHLATMLNWHEPCSKVTIKKLQEGINISHLHILSHTCICTAVNYEGLNISLQYSCWVFIGLEWFSAKRYYKVMKLCEELKRKTSFSALVLMLSANKAKKTAPEIPYVSFLET